jgi:hypothetical protein
MFAVSPAEITALRREACSRRPEFLAERDQGSDFL